MFGYVLSLLLGSVNRGLGTGHSPGMPVEYDVSCGFVFALV